jgi:hypothetical protein
MIEVMCLITFQRAKHARLKINLQRNLNEIRTSKYNTYVLQIIYRDTIIHYITLYTICIKNNINSDVYNFIGHGRLKYSKHFCPRALVIVIIIIIRSTECDGV